MVSVDRLQGISGDLGVKCPVRVATTANITLSGLQTIDGITVVAGDRVLVKDQTNAADNGIWNATTSSWSRALDFDAENDAVAGTLIIVSEGSDNGGVAFRISNTGSITIGTTLLTFAAHSLGSLGTPIGSSLIGHQPTTGAATTVQLELRSHEAKLHGMVSVRSHGAVGDGTDQTAAFSAAAQAAVSAVNIIGAEAALPRAPMCRVYVPAGDYLLTSEIDTGGREVVWEIDQAATISGYAFLNGEIMRPGQRLADHHHGTTDYACTYSIRANNDLDDGAEVLGLTSETQLATYSDRDSVALYVDNVAPAASVDAASAAYTATTVTITAPSTAALRRYRRGMIVDTKHVPKWSGIVDSWNADGSVLTVTAWYQVGGGGVAGTPAGTDGCVINAFTKVWAHNANVHLVSGSYAPKATGFELGVLNNKGVLDFAAQTNYTWGFDAVNLGTYEGGIGYIARHSSAKWYRGFQCSDATQAGFYVGGTPAYGFWSEQTSGDPYRYTKGGVTLFRVDSDGLLSASGGLTCNAANGSLSLGSVTGANTPFVDFNSSGNSIDYDVRLTASGGTAVAGNGVFTITAAGGTKFAGPVSSNGDNVHPNGSASNRWSVIYAATGAINTSDARQKQQIRELSAAEKAVAIRIKGLIRAFKFSDAVSIKGAGARIHVGVIAQDVEAAFAAEGLNGFDYGVLCYDEWEELPEVVESWGDEYDENGELIRKAGSVMVQQFRPAGSRYGVRYEEMLAFILSAL